MAEPFLAEIRLMSFNFAPKGWAQCNGQLLPINQNQALFALLGTTYGGDGRVNFALPDLRGRVPIHVGSGFTLGQRAGEQAHTLTTNEMPAHTHTVQATNSTGNVIFPSSTAVVADVAPSQVYSAPQNLGAMHPTVISSIGGSQPHQTMQPFLTLTFCIALQGIFPSPN